MIEFATEEAETKAGSRSEESYMIDAAAKVMKVFEALEGRAYEPVTIARVHQRTGYPRSFCRDALITLKKLGWAKEIVSTKERQFILGPKAENLARRYGASLIAGSSSARIENTD